MAQGIKEVTDLVSGLKVLAIAGKGIAADGKVSIEDLQHVIALVKDINVLIEAVKGVDQIPSEIKDLDGAELMLIGQKVLDLVNEIRK